MNDDEAAPKQNRGQWKQLERAFDVIEALLRTAQPLRLTALSEVTGLDASGTLRLLKTLADLGYVVRDDERKTYLPGARAAFPLGLMHPLQELRRDATELLLDIQRITTVTSALQVFLGGQRIVVELRHGASRLTPFWDTVSDSPHHSSASGKVLLTTLARTARLDLLGPGPFQAFTERTLTTHEALDRDLQAGLARGYFSAEEEAIVGMSSVAAPIRAATGVAIGAVIATGTSGQLPGDRLGAAGVAVKRAGDMLGTMSPAVRALETLLGRGHRTPAPAATDPRG